jgi:hypothetical protein
MKISIRKKFIFIFFSLIFITSISNLYAGGGFSVVGYNARAIGLGGTFLTQSGVPYSLFYNPASISDIKSLSLSSTYIKLFPNVDEDNLNYYTLSAAIPLSPIGVLGIGATMFTTNFWNENILYGTYSRDIFSNFSVGGSVKILRWSATAAPGESALSYFGITADAGARYTMQDFIPGNDLIFGAAVKNINQPSIAKNSSTDAQLPMSLEFGIGYNSNIYNYGLMLALQKEGEETKIHVGGEIQAAKAKIYDLDFKLLFRAGGESITSVGRQGQMNAGIGITVDKFTLDYAYVYHFEMINMDGNHVLSLSYSF